MSRLVMFLILFPFAVWAVYSARRKARAREEKQENAAEKPVRPVRLVTEADIRRRSHPVRTTIQVDGMCCEGCARRLEQSVQKLPDTLAAASFEKGRLILYSRSPQDPAEIQARIAEAGFAEKQEIL